MTKPAIEVKPFDLQVDVYVVGEAHGVAGARVLVGRGPDQAAALGAARETLRTLLDEVDDRSWDTWATLKREPKGTR